MSSSRTLWTFAISSIALFMVTLDNLVVTTAIAIFTLGSIAAALAPSVDTLNLARAFQGLGGAIVMPLTLTILSNAVPAAKRGLALGAWGGISGLAVAFGPLVGGAIVQGIAWQWIFW